MLEKMKNGIIRFMYGRSGPDSLYKASLVLYMILAVVNIFAQSLVISLLMTVLFVWTMYRCFSKNVFKRQQENIRYLNFADGIKKKFRLYKAMLTDKEHCFRKCKKCRTVMRLPRKKGCHTVNCPRCHETNNVKIR